MGGGEEKLPVSTESFRGVVFEFICRFVVHVGVPALVICLALLCVYYDCAVYSGLLFAFFFFCSSAHIYYPQRGIRMSICCAAEARVSLVVEVAIGNIEMAEKLLSSSHQEAGFWLAGFFSFSRKGLN